MQHRLGNPSFRLHLGTGAVLRGGPRRSLLSLAVALLMIVLLGETGCLPLPGGDPPPPPPVTLFGDRAPSQPAAADDRAVELGVKVRASTGGRLVGVRFFKGAGNTGQHVGSVWSTDGTRLATARFEAETDTGWQQAALDHPVDVSPGVTYVVSYFAPRGHYAADLDSFAPGGPGTSAPTAPLRALTDGEDGPNSVFRYGPSGYPDRSYRSANYWVDATFVPDAPSTSSTMAGRDGPPPTTVVRGGPGRAVPGFTPDYWAKWSAGPPPDPSWFPLAVFDNDPVANDVAFKAAHLNLYLGLYDFGKRQDAYLNGLREHGSHGMAGDPADVAGVLRDLALGAQLWGYQPADEPEMKGYTAADVRRWYDAIVAQDRTRPVYVGYGKGLSLPSPDNNPFTNGDAPTAYCSVPDVVGADYYGPQDPYNGPDGLWVYGRTMDLLRARCPDIRKPIWAIVAVERVNGPGDKGGRLPAPTPDELVQSVWESIIHGANGIVYFCHDFGDQSLPTWDSKCLYDPQRTPAMSQVNERILRYANVLNSPTRTGAVTVTASRSIPVATLVKYVPGAAYVFAMADGTTATPNSGATTATFTVDGASTGTVEVLDEHRSLPLRNGAFVDDFRPYGVHIYRISM